MRIFLTFQVLGSKRVLGIPIAFSVHLRFCLEKATHKTRFGGFMSHPQVRYRPGSHIPNQVLIFRKLVLMPPETSKRVLKTENTFWPQNLKCQNYAHFRKHVLLSVSCFWMWDCNQNVFLKNWGVFVHLLFIGENLFCTLNQYLRILSAAGSRLTKPRFRGQNVFPSSKVRLFVHKLPYELI